MNTPRLTTRQRDFLENMFNVLEARQGAVNSVAEIQFDDSEERTVQALSRKGLLTIGPLRLVRLTDAGVRLSEFQFGE